MLYHIFEEQLIFGIHLKIMYQKDLELHRNWDNLLGKLEESIGKRPGNLKSVLFLIGVHELGKGKKNFSKTISPRLEGLLIVGDKLLQSLNCFEPPPKVFSSDFRLKLASRFKCLRRFVGSLAKDVSSSKNFSALLLTLQSKFVLFVGQFVGD